MPVRTGRTITATGSRENGGEITIGDLRELLRQYDEAAAAAGEAGDVPEVVARASDERRPRVKVSFRGACRKIEITVPW